MVDVRLGTIPNTNLAVLVFLENYIAQPEQNNWFYYQSTTSFPSLGDDLFVFENPSLTDCCGLYNLLCADPPLCSDDNVGDAVVIFGNGVGCEVTDIVIGGPCN